jgi:hypothetical protein
LASSESYFSADFVQRHHNIESRRATADYRHISSLELAQIVMIGSVGKRARWQMGETRRHVGKVGYADGDNNAVCRDRLAVIQPQEKALGRPVQPDDRSTLHIWNKLSLKGKPVRRERFEWYRNVYGLVWKPVLRAKTR